MGRRSLVKIKIFILAIIFSKAQSSCEALCVVPVADLLKKSAYEIFTEINSAKEAYKSLLMGDTKCKREYQILFNELVDILQIRDEEVQIRVPHIVYFDEEKNINIRIKDFVKLLKSWANLDSGFIPYLYSGSSFIYAYHRDEILQRYSDNTFYRDELDVYPYTGFDCSCIISRATQICNLPYFYKDSITLERNLEQLNKFEELSEGDVIWFPGHVLIVSDLKNNLVIEARGYTSGYGLIHECHISKMFENINSFKELFELKTNHKKLKLLAKDGTLRYIIEEFKILSLKSGLYKEFKSLYDPVNRLDTSKCHSSLFPV